MGYRLRSWLAAPLVMSGSVMKLEEQLRRTARAFREPGHEEYTDRRLARRRVAVTVMTSAWDGARHAPQNYAAHFLLSAPHSSPYKYVALQPMCGPPKIGDLYVVQ